MRIVLAAVSSNRSMSGVSRHAANMARCLLTRSEVTALHVLVAPWEEEYVREAILRKDRRLFVHSVQLQHGTVTRNAWYLRRLPSIAEQLRADLVHFAYPSPIRRGAFPCPTVVTLHDLYPYDIPSNFRFPKVLFNRLILRQCLGNADAIACVSESTNLRLGASMPEMLSKTVTICNCVEAGPMPRQPSFASSWTGQSFLLCVAQHRRNKNLLLALRVFRRVLASGAIPQKSHLLIVGLPGPETGRLHKFIRAAKLGQNVTFADGVSDPELSWCYRNCELLLAPSSIEGFGLPIVEAQLAGCRVICSDIAAFRELASAGCQFVSLGGDAERDFASAVVAATSVRRPLPASLPQFSPPVIAEQYLRLYDRMLLRSKTEAGSDLPMIDEVPQAESPVAARFPTVARF